MEETGAMAAIDPGRIAVSVAEAAIACGVCERTISDAIRAGVLPAARIGSRILILRSSLVEWIKSRTDTSGALVRPDLSEGLRARNRARWEKHRANKEASKV